MAVRFNKSFKIQAVEKALGRSKVTSLREVAGSLGIAPSTLNEWVIKAREQKIETVSLNEIKPMTQDKRPHDWTQKERLNIVIACSTLSDEKLNEYCRKQGIYPHHIEQWKNDFVCGNSANHQVKNNTEMKELKQENKTLKKELHRKDKALAETAALLVLKKKVNAIWGNEEDNSL